MRSHYCGEICQDHIDQTIQLCGWVHRRRDHGGVIFIDLRDKKGLVQIVFDPENLESFAHAEQVRNEYVLQITGIVRIRPDGTENPDLATGAIEVLVEKLSVLNQAQTPAFPIDNYAEVHEDTRLRYRYLDLRRPEMLQKIMLRAQIIRQFRHFLEQQEFNEIETPMLTKATPEGARDYLVPSRTHQGQFFALPQSPQLFKQLLMMSGMDRYYQVVRCFRDEDLRSDRQPEFTQLDIELSFVDEEQVMSLMEAMLRDVFARVLEIPLHDPFPRMTYQEAMQRFGSDRPDLRIRLELVDIADLLQDVEFKVFAGPANDENGRVAVLRVPQGCHLTRKEIDDYTKFVGIYGAKGLAYVKVKDIQQGREGLQSPILKFLPDSAIEGILKRTQAQSNDLLFFGADKAKVVSESLGALRVKLAHDKGFIEHGWKPVWVTDFPMFDWNEDEQRWQALHHPFTAPNTNDVATLAQNPKASLSRAYDLVLNGVEVGGGSIRIHQTDMQMAVFKILGITEQEISDKFGFFVDALKYGCPPHGGIAFGLDRLIALMTGSASIREVIAFPKTQTAHCPLSNAPSIVDQRQLRELGIRLR